MTRAAFIPVDANQVMPYLTVTDGKRLLDFLVGVFDAAVVRRHEESDGRLAHAAVRIGDSIIELSDASAEWGPTPAALHLYVPEVDATYRKALDHGATSFTRPWTRNTVSGPARCKIHLETSGTWPQRFPNRSLGLYRNLGQDSSGGARRAPEAGDRPRASNSSGSMDVAFMQSALALAERGRGHVSPNPMVGALVVADGRIVGEGWHRRAGGAHAEVAALEAAGARARGATMYVTLEPCNHFGRTPPCAPALVEAGLERLVVAVSDPNPHVEGRGIDLLRDHGVQVECGVCEDEARELNRAFFTWALRGRPFVTLKTAMSLDGRIACRSGHSQWITGEASRRRVHEERAHHDAILVGVNTVLADDPRLDVRLDGGHRSPRRVVLDSSLRTPPLARVVPDAWIFCGPQASLARRRALEERGAEVIEVAPAVDGRVSVGAALQVLGERRVLSLLVEGGGQVHASFLRDHLADRVMAFVAPLVLGGRQAPTPLGRLDAGASAASLPLRKVSVRRSEDDVLIEGFLQEVWT